MLQQITCPPASQGLPPLDPLKTRQQATWSAGNYALIGSSLQIVGESLCEAMDVRSGQRLLDVAAGNGNAALAAARRFCVVTASDYVQQLLDLAMARAAADGLTLECRIADAEALPFADASFDLVTSTFGAMFTPRHEKPAQEMLRVVKAGGKIGLANWTPDGFIGQLFVTIGRHVPPPAGLASPALWGTRDHLEALFGAAAKMTTERRDFVFRYRSPTHFIEMFRKWYGPVLKAFEALPPEGQDKLHGDLLSLIARFNRADDGTMVVPSSYLQAVIVKS
jgi:ubiquinone/menaquinone biosynthesis C-methylase UbiE